MKTLNRNDAIRIGESARLGRSRRRPRRRLLRAVCRVTSSLRFAKGSARGRAERQPWRLRSPLVSPESIPSRAIIIALSCATTLLLTSALKAQTFTTLYSFTGGDDGGNIHASLILSGNTLYGTTAENRGSAGNGTVFAVNTDGTGFTTLHNFTGSDGASPYAGLVLSGSTLYRTASAGGSTGGGTVFAVNTDGTGFTALHSFTGSDGIEPNAGLILSGNTLYGTAFLGGSAGNGTVFAVNTDGTGFTNLHSFTAFSGSVCCVNSDGAGPASLLLSGNTLYGTAPDGGSSGYGTVFSLSLPVPPPLLTITSAGANVILTWPTNATGFTLQSAPALTATFTNLPGATSHYTNALTASQQYFRLKSD